MVDISIDAWFRWVSNTCPYAPAASGNVAADDVV